MIRIFLAKRYEGDKFLGVGCDHCEDGSTHVAEFTVFGGQTMTLCRRCLEDAVKTMQMEVLMHKTGESKREGKNGV